VDGAAGGALVSSRRARAAALLERSGLGAVVRRLPLWRGVVALGYHRIGDPATAQLDRGVYSATEEDFDAQLDLLSKDFDVIALGDLEGALADRRGRALLLTFDDGYADQLDLAARMLHARGLPAAFFLTTGFLDGGRLAWWDEIAWMVRAGGDYREESVKVQLQRYRELRGEEGERFLEGLAESTGSGRPNATALSPWMSWDGARELLRLGHSIGGHTVTHPILAQLDREGQRREIGGSLERLRDELGVAADCFAYPSGHSGSFDATTRELLRENGARWAFSFRGGWERPGAADAYDLRRVGVFSDHTSPLVAATVSVPYLLGREER
jgi:peptidoglycan/xylan/chitin deacetylase (PgdA/CDA1 family)